jgi:hypothetical protein
MTVLERALKAAWAEVKKPEAYVKGDEFEDYVRQCLFPRERYDLLHRTHDYRANESDFVEGSKDPDFRFRSRRSGREFWVEVKYRSRLYQEAVEWCKPYQLSRYKRIDRSVPVFIAIGLGGSPSSPGHIYLVPVRDIKYRSLFPSFLRLYEVPTGRCINVDRILSSL